MTKEEYLAKHGAWAEVYTYVANDGTNITLAIRELIAAVKAAKLKAVLVPVHEKEVERFVRDDVIVPKRLAELTELMIKNRKMFDPILVCIRRDGYAFVADGHHRFVLASALGQKNIGAFVCYPPLWEQFVITDMEPMTQEQLKSAPHPSQLKPSPWNQNK
jgi:hypothetical protein